VEQTQQPFQSTNLKSLSGTAVQPLRLLQPPSDRHHQGTHCSTQPIDFASWKSKIITKGLVDAVQKNYEEQASKEYDLDKVFNDIFSKDSKAID